MKKLFVDMILLTPFIAVYEVHNELIAMGVSAHIALGFMVLTTALMLIVLVLAINKLKNCMKKKCEPKVHQ